MKNKENIKLLQIANNIMRKDIERLENAIFEMTKEFEYVNSRISQRNYDISAKIDNLKDRLDKIRPTPSHPEEGIFTRAWNSALRKNKEAKS